MLLRRQGHDASSRRYVGWMMLGFAAVVCVVGCAWIASPIMAGRSRERSLIALAARPPTLSRDEFVRAAQLQIDGIVDPRNQHQFSLASEMTSPSIMRSLAARRWQDDAVTDVCAIIRGDRWKSAKEQHDDKAAAMAHLGRGFAMNCALLSIALDYGTPEERARIKNAIVLSLQQASETWSITFAQCMINSPLLFREEWMHLLQEQAAGHGPRANAAQRTLRRFDRLVERSPQSPAPTP